MYVASRFALEPERAVELAAQIGVGELITAGPRGLDATLLPFNIKYDDADTLHLHSHMARINPQAGDSGPCLMVVTGPNTYISPSDMPPGPADAPLARVPTWNYLTVHLRGELTIHEDPAWLIPTLRELVDAHEIAHHGGTWRPDTHARPEQLRRMLRAIVGVDIKVTEIIGKAKLSQNLSTEEIAATAVNLRRRREKNAATQIAELMENLAIPTAAAREEAVERAKHGPWAARAGTEAEEDGVVSD
ncbi:FMN-binding negative transcriptional regulator [Actinotignum sanguinis]|uniref:FMN-binding negative transcriptional regulator n=1 Tax=Actinotignum sanguinis TaxID=1445614 RepID=UPI00254C1531|nr:FMN-binding negative transcriptional regulator [Actinotignum sanguinis]MDK8354004.1 FMN-binding negative transcriptional regulator [Actinotignum sanguinis]